MGGFGGSPPRFRRNFENANCIRANLGAFGQLPEWNIKLPEKWGGTVPTLPPRPVRLWSLYEPVCRTCTRLTLYTFAAPATICSSTRLSKLYTIVVTLKYRTCTRLSLQIYQIVNVPQWQPLCPIVTVPDCRHSMYPIVTVQNMTSETWDPGSIKFEIWKWFLD